MIFAVIYFINVYFVESRVYCSDAKASKWMPLGFSCPVNCHNVLSAVNRLKYLDYKRISLTKNINIDDSEIEESMESHSNKDKLEAIQFKMQNSKRKSYSEKILHKKPNNTSKNTYMKNFFQKLLYKEPNNTSVQNKLLKIQMELASVIKTFNNGTCSVFNVTENFNMADTTIDKFITCARRFNIDAEFIKLFTKIMNKYFPSYKFTYKTTEVLLDKILGQADLRHGEGHVKHILKYLGQAVHAYNEVRNQTTVLRLKSRHCLLNYVSGCYCKSGYVEHFGRCMKPSKCITQYTQHNDKYIHRIIVY